MEIVNVLETKNGIPENIESFIIFEPQLSEDVVKQAEAYFKKNVESKLDGGEEFNDEWLDNGHWENRNGYEIYIIWSYSN